MLQGNLLQPFAGKRLHADLFFMGLLHLSGSVPQLPAHRRLMILHTFIADAEADGFFQFKGFRVHIGVLDRIPSSSQEIISGAKKKRFA